MATKVASPGSFPELLRRSRFASFDPTIRQSYGTPPSHLHRGNWGLKRPIPQRKRNAFISLKNFEEREHYIEWSNEETQVRLINKIEELNVAPKLVPQVPWFVGLGPAASTLWSKMDSDFAPGESGSMPDLPDSLPSFTPKLEGLGLRGKGEYGKKPSTEASDDGYLHPNLRAMSPRVFKRYLEKLRSLRPEFQKFLQENDVKTSVRDSGIPPGNLHVRFLGQHFNKQFRDGKEDVHPDQAQKTNIHPDHDIHPNQAQPIRKQPHRLGGLMYASPTYLESFFTFGIQPAIVLEDANKTSDGKNYFLVSIAGLVAKLEAKKAGANIKPAFDAEGLNYPPAALMARETGVSNTFINVRVIDLQLETLPTAVTAFPSASSSKEVCIRMEVAVHPPQNDHLRTNTHPPGSMLYNAPETNKQQEHSIRAFTREARMYNRNPANNLFVGNSIIEKLRNIGKSDTNSDGNSEDTIDKLGKLNSGGKPLGQATNSGGMKWDRRKNRDEEQWDVWEDGGSKEE